MTVNEIVDEMVSGATSPDKARYTRFVKALVAELVQINPDCPTEAEAIEHVALTNEGIFAENNGTEYLIHLWGDFGSPAGKKADRWGS